MLSSLGLRSASDFAVLSMGGLTVVLCITAKVGKKSNLLAMNIAAASSHMLNADLRIWTLRVEGINPKRAIVLAE